MIRSRLERQGPEQLREWDEDEGEYGDAVGPNLRVFKGIRVSLK